MRGCPPPSSRLWRSASTRRPVGCRWWCAGTCAGRDYDGAKAGYFPFNRLVEEDPESRGGLARLARAAAAADRDVFITVNNKAEGSSPLSVLRLAEAIHSLSLIRSAD